MDLTDYIPSVADFPIAGVSFKDITPLLASPEAFRESVDRLIEGTADLGFDKIAAFDARGFLWAAPMAYQLNLPIIPIRKAGKLPREAVSDTYRGEYDDVIVEMHADAVGAGDRVLLVDDVIATGESMRSGCRLVERLGGTVAGCAAVIELTFLGAAEKLTAYPVVSLVRF